ncbi:MAG: hypothetical protein ACRD0J_07985, partial [Acidimicrobiales bacterium]
VTQAGPGLAEVTVPSWRPDSTREIDVVEEIARHHGYSSIARTRPVPPGVGGLTPYQHDRRRVRASLVALGASEAWTPSLLAPDDHAKVGLGRLTGSRREPAPAGVPAPMDDSAASSPVASDGVPDPSLEVENPLAREESVLRRTLLPGLLRALAANASHRVAEVRLFEVGHVFARPPQGRPLADERELVAVALARAGDDARSAVSAWRWLAETLRLAPVELVAADPPGLHPTRSARLVVPGAGPGQIGVVGEVDPAVLEGFDLGGRRVGWLELDLGALLAGPRRPEALAPVGRFPSADIDLAFVVDDAVPAAAVEETLSRAGGERLVGLELFDVYRGGQWGAGRRSLAYRLRLASLDHTLTDEELASLRATCVAAVEQAHPARLRG